MPDLDRLDTDLRTLAADGARAARALPASDVRRRGARRRTTRRAGTAAAALVLVAGAAVAVSGTGGKVQTAPPAAPQLPATVLPEQMTFLADSPDLRWTADSATERDRRVSVCQRGTLTSLGATDTLTRSYTWEADLGPGEVADTSRPQPQLDVLVGQFADVGDGRAAYRTVSGWVEDCRAAGRLAGTSDTGPVERFSTVEDGGAQGWTAILTYEEEPAYSPDDIVFDTHAVGLSADGTRVVLVSERLLGQDYNATPEEAPITVRLRQVLATMG